MGGAWEGRNRCTKDGQRSRHDRRMYWYARVKRPMPSRLGIMVNQQHKSPKKVHTDHSIDPCKNHEER